MNPTLAELIASHPDRFYPQTWYVNEAFLLVRACEVKTPSRVLPSETQFAFMHELPSAATLAWLWVQHPDHRMWRRYLWTRDTDAVGQRVYVGQNGKGLEIHRHLHLTTRWGYPVWDVAA